MALDVARWHSFYEWLYGSVMTDFALQTFKSYKEMNNDLELDEDMWDEAQDFMQETILLREGEVLQTTRKRLEKAVALVLLLGGGTDELQREIKKMYKHDIPIRSRAIAQTEVITAGNAATSFAARTLGASKKEWVAVMDGRTRDSHRAVDGETIPILELYSNGLMFPGQPGAPAAETINCRCVEVYFL